MIADKLFEKVKKNSSLCWTRYKLRLYTRGV